jgi:hypothetical protein
MTRMQPKVILTAFAVSALLSTGLPRTSLSRQASRSPSPVVEAARQARERVAGASKSPKVITNAELGEPDSGIGDSAFSMPLGPIFGQQAGVPAQSPDVCDNPDAQRIRAKLQDATQEMDQLNAGLSYKDQVVSGNNVDMTNFKPGRSGLFVGSPPLSDSRPPVDARIAQVKLQDRIDGLQQALRIACEPPEAAAIQGQLDSAQRDLGWLLRQFDLDQNAFYSNANYARNSSGKARLDAEAAEIAIVQRRVDQLKSDLDAALKENR